MQNGNIIPFRGCRRRSHGDDRGARRPMQMPMQLFVTVGLLGFVSGVLFVVALLIP